MFIYFYFKSLFDKMKHSCSNYSDQKYFGMYDKLMVQYIIDIVYFIFLIICQVLMYNNLKQRPCLNEGMHIIIV